MNNEIGSTLLDEASLEDQFTGGGHSRTASQLRRSIEGFAEHEKNRAIGLEGNWGSGKTTVVGFVERALCEAHKSGKGLNYRFFTFDLWSANTVHFKRTLLEELIDWAERPDISKDLEVERDRVRDREITTTSDLRLKFSRLGILFFALLPLIPVAYSWLGPEAFNNSKVIFEIDWLSESVGEWWGKVTGWKLAALSLLTLIVPATISVLRRWLKMGESFDDAISHVLSLVTHKDKTNTITQNIREKDPNEHEFDNHFRKILALVQSDGSKVVLVFDNIDRLNDDDLVDYWALVRSVFSSSNVRPVQKDQSCIVVVPYVAKAIKESFTNGHGGGDLFAKTFDVRHRIAQPILSNVAEFLSLKLEERFGSTLIAEDRSAMIEIYEFSSRQRDLTATTPRDIKTYVNEVADLHAAWGESVPIPAIAIYVQNRDRIEADPSVLQVRDEDISKYFRFDASGDTVKYLAALTFNVDPELAYQTLLLPEILGALSRGEKHRLEELEKVEGFFQVFRQVSQHHASTIAGDGLTSLAHLSECARRICADKFQRDQFAKEILAAIASLPSENIWDLENLENFDSILSVLDGVDKSEIVPVIAELLEKPIGDKPSYDLGRSWSYAVTRTTEKLVANGFGEWDEFASSFDKARGASFALGVASTCDVANINRERLTKTFAVRDLKDSFLAIAESNTNQVANVISGLVEAGKYSQDLATNLLAVLKNGLVSEVVDNVERYITWTSAFAEAYQLSSSKAKSKARQQLEELIDHGGFVWHIHNFCNAGKNDELLALALELTLTRLNEQDFTQKPSANVATFSNFHPSSQWFAQLLSGSIEISEEAYSAFAKRCAGEYLNETISLAQADLQHSKVARSALKAMVAPGVERSPRLVSSILSDEGWLRTNNPQLLACMLEDTQDMIIEKDIEAIDLDAITVSFLTDALAVDSDGWKKYDKAVATKFEDLEESSWSSLLHDGGNAYELLLAKLDGLGAKPKINSANLRNPLEVHFLTVLAGDAKVSTEIGDLAFGIISDAMRKNVVKAVAGKFSKTDFSVDSVIRTDALFPKTLNQIFAHSAFAPSADVVITSLVSTRDERVLGLLGQHAEVLAFHISKLNEDGKLALRESFLGWHEVSESPNAIVEAAQSLGIDVDFPASSIASESEEDHK